MVLPIGPVPTLDQGLGRAALELVRAHSLQDALNGALNVLCRATGAREAYVELLTDDGGVESSHIAANGCSGERVQEIQGLVSRGIVGEAMATGRTIESANAQLDPRFFERESVQRHAIEAVLCVPIGGEEPLGVIYLQGHADGHSGKFAPSVRSDVELLAQLIALLGTRLMGKPPRVGGQPDVRVNDVFSAIVGESPALRAVVDKLRFVAPLDVHVLFTGASGSGKTQLAQLTHQASRRGARSFVELNCATVPEALLENELFGAEPGAHSAVPRGGSRGKLELAEGGTLFLDEVGELPLVAQAKLLQLLHSKTYYRLGGTQMLRADIRVMAATNADLKRAIQEKRFREDLYYRLKVVEIRVPSLAERPEDILPLARHFLRLAVERHELGHKGLSPSAVRVIQSTQWDGNIRELAHHVEAAALSAEQRGAARIEQRDLLAHGGATSESEPVTLHQAVNAFQRRHIASVLASTGWNMTEAARLLDISRGHLYTLIRNLDLKRTPTSGVRTE